MPHRAYNHKCTCNAGRKFAEYCPDCNIKGEVNGWGLNRIENMGNYIRNTGFAPVGYHRHLVDCLFYQDWKRCQDCNGIGVVDANNLEGWEYCSNCDSKGGFYIGGRDDWYRMIYEVVSAYPNSIGGAHQEEYNEIYNKYKYELENPKPALTDEDTANSHNRNGGGAFY